MASVKRRLKNALKSGMRHFFEQFQRFGYDVLPRHFYSEIPVIRDLRRSAHWKAPFSMAGVSGVDTQQQLAFLGECCTPAIITELKSRDIHAAACETAGEVGFGRVEADLLFAFVATHKPPQIFQIGCGVSTAICLMAAEYAGYTPEIICVEPYAGDFLTKEAGRGRIKLVRERAQLLDVKVMNDLGADVFFFVDSTHTLGPAGETSRIILEMLPRLKAGASIHFHDIWFPYDYDSHLLDAALFFWHESVLLHAFLAYNSRFTLRASMSMLHHACPGEMGKFLPNYQPAPMDQGLCIGPGHFPVSAYLQALP